jgi:uncharacterized membrane protein
MDAVSSPQLHADSAQGSWRVTPWRLVGALMVAALAIRVLGGIGRPLWLDESYSAWFSSRSWHVLWTEVPAYEPHPPFYYSLLKVWRGLTGDSAMALRSFSWLFALAAIPMTVAAANEIERQRPSGNPLVRSGLAACLMAVSPMLVLMGAEARPYPLLIFAYAVALLGVLRLIGEFRDGPGGTASWLMLVAGTELGLWAHGLGLIFAVCIALALAPAWLHRADRPRQIRGLAAAGSIAALYLPCLLMMARRAGDWGSGWLSWEPAMALQLVGLYTVPVEVLTIASAVAALVMILLAKRAIQDGVDLRGWTADRAILLLWWGPPLLAILISSLAMPVFLPRTLTPTLVPAYLALAGAVARSPSARERFVLSAALAITIVPAAVQAALRPATEPWDEVSTYLRAHVRPGDQVWLYPNDSALPLREAGSTLTMRGVPGDYPAISFKGPVRAGSPAVVSLTARQADAIANERSLREVQTVWLVTRQSGVFDPAGDLPRALLQQRTPGVEHQWEAISVRPYARR